MDYHLTKTESLIMNKVKHSYLPALHQNLQQQLTQQPTQAVVSQQDRQQQRQQQQQIMTNSEHMANLLIEKIGIIMHYFQVNHNERFSLEEMLYLVFLAESNDFENTMYRETVLQILSYYSVFHRVKCYYLLVDQKQRVILQKPVVFTLNQNNLINSYFTLDIPGEAVADNSDSLLVYKPGYRQDGIIINNSNLKAYLVPVYHLISERDT